MQSIFDLYAQFLNFYNNQIQINNYEKNIIISIHFIC